MKLLWYYFVKIYVRTGFAFYYKKVEVVGLENVPKKAAVLFAANHQNALIDPLLLGAFLPRELHFLTRGDIFTTPLIRAFLSSVNMLPIYRIRDGRDGLSKNEETFKACYRILKNKGSVLIFPEGNHNIQRRLRPLSKGFTRIIFGSIEGHDTGQVWVVPIGINYSNARKYASEVKIIIDSPISCNEFVEVQPDTLEKKDAIAISSDPASALKDELSNRMKKLITHIEDQSQHDYLESCFEEEAFLFPEEVNQKLTQPELLHPIEPETKEPYNLILPIVKLNSFIPLILWKKLEPKIDEVEFISTYKFSLGLSVFPITYIIQSLIVASFFGNSVGIIYLILSFLSLFLLTKSR